MPFIGNQPAEKYSAFQKQDFTTSATTSYTLDHPVANQNELALFINFVRQEPTTAYTASGTSLTLTSATSSSDDMYCIYLGKAVQTVNPPSGSVGLSQLSATGTKDATTFLRGDNTFAEAGGGKINQVLNSVATVNTSSSSDVELFNLSITPSSTSSKILAIVNVTAQLDANEYTSFDLYRGTLSSGTKVYDAGETLFNSADSTRLGYGFTYLDSPSTTSATQYTVVGSPHFGTITFGATGKNTITLIEVLV